MSPKNEFDQQEATPTLGGVQNPAGTLWQDEKTTLIEEGEAEATVWLRNAEGEIFEITAFPCTMGRGNSSDFQIKDTNLSREHARILPYGGGFVIEDLSSLNGTFVNDHRVDRVILADQDLIKIGDQQFEFYLNDPIATGAATAGAKKKKTAAPKKTVKAKTASPPRNKALLFAIAIGCGLIVTASYLYSVKGKLSRAVVTPQTTPAVTPVPQAEPTPPEPKPTSEPAPPAPTPIPSSPVAEPTPPLPVEPAPTAIAEPKPERMETAPPSTTAPEPILVTQPKPDAEPTHPVAPTKPAVAKKPAAPVTTTEGDKPAAKAKQPTPVHKQSAAPKQTGQSRNSNQQSNPALENQAKQAYQAAYRLESIDIQAATTQWQKVLTLVPPSNPYYQKAYQKLKGYGQETR